MPIGAFGCDQVGALGRVFGAIVFPAVVTRFVISGKILDFFSFFSSSSSLQFDLSTPNAIGCDRL